MSDEKILHRLNVLVILVVLTLALVLLGSLGVLQPVGRQYAPAAGSQGGPTPGGQTSFASSIIPDASHKKCIQDCPNVVVKCGKDDGVGNFYCNMDFDIPDWITDEEAQKLDGCMICLGESACNMLGIDGGGEIVKMSYLLNMLDHVATDIDSLGGAFNLCASAHEIWHLCQKGLLPDDDLNAQRRCAEGGAVDITVSCMSRFDNKICAGVDTSGISFSPDARKCYSYCAFMHQYTLSFAFDRCMCVLENSGEEMTDVELCCNCYDACLKADVTLPPKCKAIVDAVEDAGFPIENILGENRDEFCKSISTKTPHPCQYFTDKGRFNPDRDCKGIISISETTAQEDMLAVS